MNTEIVSSAAAILVAIPSAWFAWTSAKQARRSADAAEAQVAGQRESNIDAAQPYVWADVRSSDRYSRNLVVVLGNSGKTVAKNVRAVFAPPLPREDSETLTGQALDRMQNGLRSLAPGKTLQWSLGDAPKLLRDESPQVHRVTIDADGPFGPVPQLTYEIDLSDFRESLSGPIGSLHQLTQAVEGVAKAVKDGN